MAKATSNVTTTPSWSQIAAANDTFQVSCDHLIYVAYASSSPSASIVGHPVLPNTIYGDYQTAEKCWAKTPDTGTVTAAVTIEA